MYTYCMYIYIHISRLTYPKNLPNPACSKPVPSHADHPEVLVHLSWVPGESDRKGNRLGAFLALQITSQERGSEGCKDHRTKIAVESEW